MRGETLVAELQKAILDKIGLAYYSPVYQVDVNSFTFAITPNCRNNITVNIEDCFMDIKVDHSTRNIHGDNKLADRYQAHLSVASCIQNMLKISDLAARNIKASMKKHELIALSIFDNVKNCLRNNKSNHFSIRYYGYWESTTSAQYIPKIMVDHLSNPPRDNYESKRTFMCTVSKNSISIERKPLPYACFSVKQFKMNRITNMVRKWQKEVSKM